MLVFVRPLNGVAEVDEILCAGSLRFLQTRAEPWSRGSEEPAKLRSRKDICSSHDYRVNYGGCYCHGEKIILRS